MYISRGKCKLFRVAEGEVTEISTAAEAVVDGVYDESNWGGDWRIVSARTPAEALRIAGKADAWYNSGRTRKLPYLKPVTLAWEQLYRAKDQGDTERHRCNKLICRRGHRC